MVESLALTKVSLIASYCNATDMPSKKQNEATAANGAFRDGLERQSSAAWPDVFEVRKPQEARMFPRCSQEAERGFAPRVAWVALVSSTQRPGSAGRREMISLTCLASARVANSSSRGTRRKYVWFP